MTTDLSNLPTTQSALATSFTQFLTVSVHQILYLRCIYPRTTFLPVCAYNYAVRQSRHPRVCEYINDVSTAVGKEMLNGGSITTVSVIISSMTTNQPMERYVFDLSSLPRVPASEVNTRFEQRGRDNIVIDLEAQFRACLARLESACARLTPLSPDDDEFSFTVCIELREDALPPVLEEQSWIVAEPSADSKRHSSTPPLPESGHAKTVPVRRVEAGELRLELWVEEARQKFNA